MGLCRVFGSETLVISWPRSLEDFATKTPTYIYLLTRVNCSLQKWIWSRADLTYGLEFGLGKSSETS
jgi:hypothetical protein